MDAGCSFSVNASLRAGKPCTVSRIGRFSEGVLRSTQGDSRIRIEAIAKRKGGLGAGTQFAKERSWGCKLCGER
eukprot:10740273-Alexandrium_andersonii.AAC.1